MDRIASMLSLLVLLFAASVGHASLPAEIYWQKVLPNTPIPKVIMEQLYPDVKGGKPTVNLAYPKYYPPATEAQFAVFFFLLLEDLHPGSELNPGLSFISTISGSTFRPRAEADIIPFSSAKLPEILYRLNVLPDSEEAKQVKTTLDDCEAAALEGEHKFCATSLESMVDFVASNLGTHDIHLAATTVRGSKEKAPKQTYVVAPSGVRKAPGAKLVACHPQAYPYSVYYCHSTRSTEAYSVTLVGKDGTTVEAVAACHLDTSGWSPSFFKTLGVKRGTPICHFLPQDHLIWSPIR